MTQAEKIEIYERALDALIELSQFEGGHLTVAINHIRATMLEAEYPTSDRGERNYPQR